MGKAVRATVMSAAACLLLAGCQFDWTLNFGGSDQDLLDAVSLSADDAAAGATFEPYEGGNEVVGQTSLDLCYGQFDSEGRRVAREQVTIGDSTGDNWVSSEAVLYLTVEDAEQAMSELTSAAATCPDGMVDPVTPDREPLTWSFDEAPDGSWPQVDDVNRQSYEFTVTTRDGYEATSTATYLQRGRMVLALYSTPPDSAATAIRNSPDPGHFVEVMSNRLALLPDNPLMQADPGTTLPPASDGFDT